MDNDDLLDLEALSISEGEDPRGAFRVTARGEIDIATAARLHDLLTGLIDRGAHLVVLDTEGIEFLDSSGLQVLILAGNRLADAGGRLLIEGMSGAVQRVLEITGLIDQYRR
jgi:anti-anti-sigma factor